MIMTRQPLKSGACFHSPKLTFTFLPITPSVLQASPRKLGAKKQVPLFPLHCEETTMILQYRSSCIFYL